MLRNSSTVVLIVVAALLPTVSVAQTSFVEVAAGFNTYFGAPLFGAGAAAADYDADGDIDVFVPADVAHADQLYRNQGNGTFQEIAGSVGLNSTLRGRSALWFDYDGDQRLDLLVAGDCFNCVQSWCTPVNCTSGVSLLRLYRQTAGGSFLDVTSAAGLTDDAASHTVDEHRGGLAAADINNDGYLDLFVGMWHSAETGAPRLFLNDTDGTFTNITSSSGVLSVQAYWQPLMHDLSDDGWVDIYTNLDNLGSAPAGKNHLWVNQGNNTFVDGAPAANVNSGFNEMGLTTGDFDNDGDLELYMTNIFESMKRNRLYKNNSSPPTLSFQDISVAAGVDDGGWGWGTTALDADNDGWLDLAATNGYFGGTSSSGEPYVSDTTRLFLNNGTNPLTFTNVAAVSGLDDPEWGSGLIAFDYDRDGDQDLMQTTTRFPELHLYENRLENEAGPHHYLVVQPRMDGPNHWSIGAKVRIEVGATTQMRPIHAGISFLSQEPAEAFFGLGSATLVDRVVVEFPDGSMAQAINVAADQVIELNPGEGLNLIFADGFESGDASAWSAAVP